MELVNRSVSILEIQEKERCLYEWDFRIPTKGRISENIRSVPGSKYQFQKLKFKTGALAQIEHSWDFCFDTDRFDVKFSYPRSDTLSIFLTSAEVRLVSKTAVRSSHECNPPELKELEDGLEWSTFWSHQGAIDKRNESSQPTPSGGILSLTKIRSNSVDLSEQSEYWTDAIDTIRIAFTIEIERPGRCILDAEYLQNGKAVEVLAKSIEKLGQDVIL